MSFQESFETGLSTFEQEGIKSLTSMRDQLEWEGHPQAKTIKDRHGNVIRRYVYIKLLHCDDDIDSCHVQEADSNLRLINILFSYLLFLFVRWEKLKKDSDGHRARLQRSLDQFKKVRYSRTATYI